jgi:hypothetical protein
MNKKIYLISFVIISFYSSCNKYESSKAEKHQLRNELIGLWKIDSIYWVNTIGGKITLKHDSFKNENYNIAIGENLKKHSNQYNCFINLYSKNLQFKLEAKKNNISLPNKDNLICNIVFLNPNQNDSFITTNFSQNYSEFTYFKNKQCLEVFYFYTNEFYIISNKTYLTKIN